MRITVLDGYTLNPGDLDWTELRDLGETVIYDRTSQEQVVNRAFGTDIILTNKCLITKEVVDALPSLKYVGILATGFNNVDLEYCKLKGITVTNVPAYSTESVVQETFALLLEICSATSEHNSIAKDGRWSSAKDFTVYSSRLMEISGKTFGVIGYGRIGQKVASVAAAFGMNVVVYTRSERPKEEGRFFYKDLKEFLSICDVVSLHCPDNAETHGIINNESISAMKNGAVLINTARGGLVKEEDLVTALRNDKLRAYGADVLSIEPPRSGNPLLECSNTVITPHVAWATKEARARLMRVAVENVKNYVAGIITNQVN